MEGEIKGGGSVAVDKNTLMESQKNILDSGQFELWETVESMSEGIWRDKITNIAARVLAGFAAHGVATFVTATCVERSIRAADKLLEALDARWKSESKARESEPEPEEVTNALGLQGGIRSKGQSLPDKLAEVLTELEIRFTPSSDERRKTSLASIGDAHVLTLLKKEIYAALSSSVR